MNLARTVFTSFIVLFLLTTANAAPGDLDFTFSQDGKLIDTLYGISDDQGYATAVQADGKVVVAGTLNSSRELVGIIRYHCGIARYNLDGTLDTTFGNEGKLQVAFTNVFVCRAVAVQFDGKIIVAGSNSPSGAGADFALMRFNPDGTPDTSFDGDGRLTTHVTGYDSVNALAIQPDGKIVAAGVTNAATNSNFAAVRYNIDGSLDTSFDQDGKVATDFFTSIDYANAVAIQADGKIVLAGYCNFTGWEDFGLVRYNTDGSLDTTFDLDGKLVSDISGPQITDRANAVMMQRADSKIVVAGISAGGDFTVVRYNTDGALDTTFDGDGKVTTDVSPTGFGSALGGAIQSDGKIVIGGYASFPGTGFDICVVRYNPDGSLDNTFSGDGIVNTDFSTTTELAYAVAIKPDGRIVATGYFSLGSLDREFSVVVYHADGTLDTTFDGDGKVFTPMGFPVNGAAGDVAIQADGKAVVAGYYYNGANDDFMVARYNADGAPDLTFGGDGKVTTDIAVQNPFGERATSIAIQPDGKILVGGHTNPAGNDPDFAVVRYNPDGSRDVTFDGDGVVTTSFSSHEYINDIGIQPDGKIVAVGYVFVASAYDIAVARYNADGSPDLSFDGDGKLTTDFAGGGDRAESVAFQADGKIVVAGGGSIGPGFDFQLVRYNADGSLDTSFDGDGKLTTDITGLNDGANAVAIQADGKIIAAGAGGSFNSLDFAIVRYNPNGSLDTTFDLDGKVTTSFFVRDNAYGMAIQPDGRIVLAGYSDNGTHNDAALARYNADGSLDASFGTGGTRTFDMGLGGSDVIYGMALDSIGRIVIAGESRSPSPTDTVGRISIARVVGDRAPRTTAFDFDGDGKTDISIFRPSLGEWWYLKSSNGGNAAFGFGNSTDKLVPGDYTGDGKVDIAVFRPSTGEWFVLRSENVSFYSFPFGANGDIPQVADFDADGKADPAVFRPSNSTWYINRSSGGTIIQQFGAPGDVPVAADYDGDSRADLAIWRASAGQWWLNRSTAGVIALGFGNSTDKPVQGDYTGDGRADVTFFRPSTGEWFVLRSETNNTYYAFPFGAIGDTPAPGDYDGDGNFDAGVFRSSNSTWYIQRSTAGTLVQAFGAAGDMAVPNAFVP